MDLFALLLLDEIAFAAHHLDLPAAIFLDASRLIHDALGIPTWYQQGPGLWLAGAFTTVVPSCGPPLAHAWTLPRPHKYPSKQARKGNDEDRSARMHRHSPVADADKTCVVWILTHKWWNGHGSNKKEIKQN